LQEKVQEKAAEIAIQCSQLTKKTMTIDDLSKRYLSERAETERQLSTYNARLKETEEEIVSILSDKHQLLQSLTLLSEEKERQVSQLQHAVAEAQSESAASKAEMVALKAKLSARHLVTSDVIIMEPMESCSMCEALTQNCENTNKKRAEWEQIAMKYEKEIVELESKLYDCDQEEGEQENEHAAAIVHRRERHLKLEQSAILGTDDDSLYESKEFEAYMSAAVAESTKPLCDGCLELEKDISAANLEIASLHKESTSIVELLAVQKSILTNEWGELYTSAKDEAYELRLELWRMKEVIDGLQSSSNPVEPNLHLIAEDSLNTNLVNHKNDLVSNSIEEALNMNVVEKALNMIQFETADSLAHEVRNSSIANVEADIDAEMIAGTEWVEGIPLSPPTPRGNGTDLATIPTGSDEVKAMGAAIDQTQDQLGTSIVIHTMSCIDSTCTPMAMPRGQDTGTGDHEALLSQLSAAEEWHLRCAP